MQVKVFVTPRKGILDPQGRAVEQSLKTLGFAGVAAVRVGRYIVLEFDASNLEQARETVRTNVRTVADQSEYRGLHFRN